MRIMSPLYSSRSFRVSVVFAIVVFAILASVQFFNYSFRVQAVSTNVVISEFRVRGPNGGNDEFIELYNLSGAPVAIGGWNIRGSNNAAGVSIRATITAGTTIQPGCHYLLTNSAAGGYSGAVPGNQTYTVGITDDGGIALTLSDGTIVDAVGMSTGSAYKEGTVLANLGTSNLNRGYERKPGGAAGSGTDTDNNSADFQLITPSDPQNSTTGCVSPSPSPSPS
ncbi:MAG TPA: lamin tail domain-containing protein, partial [Pyrinomonadaceae bacterium]